MYHDETRIDRLKSFLRRTFLCFDRSDSSPPLKIGRPTNFVHLENPFPVKGLGVSREQQALIREKALADAHHITADLATQAYTQPRALSRGHAAAVYPIPSPTASQTRLARPNDSPPLPHHARRMSRARAHGRKLSARFSSFGMCGGGAGSAGSGGPDAVGLGLGLGLGLGMGGPPGKEEHDAERRGGPAAADTVAGVKSADVLGSRDDSGLGLGLSREDVLGRRSRDSDTLDGRSEDEAKEGGVKG